jgi:hypothetical protein
MVTPVAQSVELCVRFELITNGELVRLHQRSVVSIPQQPSPKPSKLSTPDSDHYAIENACLFSSQAGIVASKTGLLFDACRGCQHACSPH